MIEVEGLTKSFKDTRALRGVSFSVQRGHVLGLLGPNGAGKTTIVKILTTLLRADGGTARVGGFDVVRDAARVRTIIGLAGQYAAVDDMLTGRENLLMVGALYHLPRSTVRARTTELLQQFRLTDAADRLARGYSGGMRRRLDLAASLIAIPDVVFLDEPTIGLDPHTRADMWDTIHALTHRGVTVLLTTQYLEEADELADRILVVDEGKVIAEGTADELKARVGADVLQLQVAKIVNLAAAADTLKSLAAPGHAVTVEQDTHTLSLLVPGGAQSLIAAVRALDERGISLVDIKLRRPSLDDVFLTLTRRSTQSDTPAG
ncbi:MAG: ATP-binding cassette domain-containing protein [bacterium]|nr:ATP-binding cassette domain-containing protein [bacterium]